MAPLRHLAFLAAWSLAVVAADDHESHTHCKFSVKGSEFDLCPIFNKQAPLRTIEMEEQTPPTVTKKVYKFGVGGPLKRDAEAPENTQCPEGTWVCMTMTNTLPDRPSLPPRVLQVIPIAGNLPLSGNHTREHHPGLNVTAHLGNTTFQNGTHSALDLVLHGGQYASRPQNAWIRFRCNHRAKEPTNPEFQWFMGGTHLFTWDTRHACPTNEQRPTRSTIGPKPTAAPDADSDADPNTPSPDDTPKEDDPDDEDLFIPGAPMVESRRFGFTILLLSSCGLLALGGALYMYAPRLRAVLHRHGIDIGIGKSGGKGDRFRVGEQRLLSWAEEELALDDEDFMVNGAPRGGTRGGNGEELPLAPSPRKSAFNRGYGSAG